MKRIVRFTLFLLLFGRVVLGAQAAFTSLWIFGDGVSTTTDNTDPSPYSPTNYFGQRYCNGLVWVEVLAQLQGLAYDSNKNTSYYGQDSIALLDSVNSFVPPGDVNTALFVVWVNDADLVNDFSLYETNLPNWTTAINQAQTNHLTAIQTLYSKGVRTLVMPTAVDISKIPQYRNVSADALAFIRQRCIDYNTAFSNTLNQARAAHPNLTIYSSDTFGLLDNILANPANYGVTNALYQGKTIDALDDPALTNKSTNGPGANYIWWDNRDPTAKGQALIAAITQNLLSPLTISCPSSITTNSCTNLTVVNYAAPTIGGGLPPYTTLNVPPSGSTFSIGTTPVTCSVVDSYGNSNYCTFNVTVTKPPLSITCPNNIALAVASSNTPSGFVYGPPVGISHSGNNVTLTWSNTVPNPTGAAITYSAPTTSGGCPPVTVTNSMASGSTFPIGTTTVTNTATDSFGQTATCTFTVTLSVSPWTYSIYRTNSLYLAWMTNWPKIVTGYPAGGSSAATISYTDTTATNTTNFYRIGATSP